MTTEGRIHPTVLDASPSACQVWSAATEAHGLHAVAAATSFRFSSRPVEKDLHIAQRIVVVVVETSAQWGWTNSCLVVFARYSSFITARLAGEHSETVCGAVAFALLLEGGL